MNHERWMAMAVELARRGVGTTYPNPAVGAVLVDGERVVGQGYHRRAGEEHAEVFALFGIRTAPESAILYVTLEPCCTWGRTPPCTDLLLARGVRRVVVGMIDPNPCHRGRGLDILRSRGLEVCYHEASEPSCRSVYDESLAGDSTSLLLP